MLVSYLSEYHMYNKWARGWSAAGTPNNTNTLERMHETLKDRRRRQAQGAGGRQAAQAQALPAGR